MCIVEINSKLAVVFFLFVFFFFSRTDELVCRLLRRIKMLLRNPFVSLEGRFRGSTCVPFESTKRPFDADAVLRSVADSESEPRRL